MVSSLEKLGELLEEHNLTHADLEFILNFMDSENISPQLAMRRIKAFETLKEKLENNKEKEKVVMLEEELKQVKNQLIETRNQLQELREQKSGLESEKEELESKSELLDSEREELQHQLELIKNMQFEEEPEEEDTIPIETLEDFKMQLEETISYEEDIEQIIVPITGAISDIINSNETSFDPEKYVDSVEILIEMKSKVSKGKEEKTTPEPDTTTSKEMGVKPSQIASREQQVSSAPEPKDTDKQEATQIKEETEPDTPQKSEPVEPEKKVSEKEEQVLNLFLEFLDEADTDKSFKDRVSTICDMDEAYEYLGSIGLSQVYSFASRGIDKKDELTELLKSWKKEGIPR